MGNTPFMKSEDYKLDNPVWHSLNELHSNYSLDYSGGKFYKPNYCSFGGFVNLESFSNDIDAYANRTHNFFVVGEISKNIGKLILNKNLVCIQMILNQPIDLDIHEEITELKSDNHKKDLFNLVNIVQPGYFQRNTADLGTYFGIYKNNKLIAVTGERMKMHRFTEVSAVVTHPEHTRKGYAKQLITQTTKHILNKGKTPFLHVTASNFGAIKLYESLGFSIRRKINFWEIIKK